MPSGTSHNAVDGSSTQDFRAVQTPDVSRVRDEIHALTSTAGVYDLNTRAKIAITGNDRIRWLNGMVTNSIRDLQPGHGAYSFLLNPQGHILGDFFAYQLGDRILVDTDSSQIEKILATFDHYIIMDDVELANVSDKIASVGVSGPAAKRVLATAGFDLSELTPLQVHDLTWNQTEARVVGGEQPQFPRYEIWIAPERTAEVIRALQSGGALLIGPEAREIYRIALGVPRYGQDIRERDLPQETEQQRALNFNKGCYIGQEIVERIRSRGSVHRKFTGFRMVGAPPAIGARIQSGGKDVGEVTSSALVPAASGDTAVALGYIRREVGTPGKEVQIEQSSAIVSDLPFVDLIDK
jgi:folate-binding protein YgfZ